MNKLGIDPASTDIEAWQAFRPDGLTVRQLKLLLAKADIDIPRGALRPALLALVKQLVHDRIAALQIALPETPVMNRGRSISRDNPFQGSGEKSGRSRSTGRRRSVDNRRRSVSIGRVQTSNVFSDEKVRPPAALATPTIAEPVFLHPSLLQPGYLSAAPSSVTACTTATAAPSSAGRTPLPSRVPQATPTTASPLPYNASGITPIGSATPHGSMKSPGESTFVSPGGTRRPASVLCSAPMCIFVSLMVAAAAMMYIIATQQGGPVFCDSTSTTNPVDCLTCPQHGVCTAGILTCEEGYTKSGNTCLRKAVVIPLELRPVLRNIEYVLADHHGQLLCGSAHSKFMTQEDIQQAFTDRKDTGDVAAALTYARTEPESVPKIQFTAATNQLGDASYEYFTAEANANKPLFCVLREQVIAHHVSLSIGAVLFLLGVTMYWKIKSAIRNRRVVKNMTNACLHELNLHAQRVDRGISTEQYRDVIALQLRDKLLSEGDRHLWPQIVKRVNGDSRVGKSVAIRASFPEGTDTWEWIAPFGTDEDDAKPRRLAFD
eukprot:TRINITY_DN3616_c0_g1_i5.p1 TRINITY_DN3616_c0_g1~~TRINITY_DN3616_c0_g1_i5.p1  ORF type:complete len:548 (+),score=94.95 TRINITY_DN3616_c0_g1_i5:651-2294(+)